MPVGDGWELPPGAEPWSDFHWFKVGTKAPLVLVVLSESPNWYTGHYVEGRMCPCLEQGCEMCAAGIGAQVRYCLAVAERSSRRVGLLELGRENGQLIRSWTSRNGGLRGMTIELTKHSRSVQSRTEVVYVDETCPPWYREVGVPDVLLALYLTWHKAGVKMPAAFAERMAASCSSRPTRTG